MRVRDVARLVVGSIAVYVVMAACAASDAARGGGLDDGGSAGGGSSSSGLGDALASPVPDARAAPEITRVACDKRNAAGTTFAEHAYPGASAAELAGSVVAMVEVQTPSFDTYRHFQQFVFVRDGAVAVGCAGSVTFIRR